MDWVYQLFPRLKEREVQAAGTMSGGERQMLAIGRALMAKPRLLMLDEPTQGVDVGAKSEIHKIIRRLAKEGLAVILISSDLPEVIGMSDRIGVMRDGKLIQVGAPREIYEKPATIDVAKFVGFLQFYSCFIPHFKVQISAFRELMKEDYSSPLGPAWTPTHLAIFDEMRQSILDDPCIKRFDHRKLLVLCTDFSADGFGYVALQPGDDDAPAGPRPAAARPARLPPGRRYSARSRAAALTTPPLC